MFPTITYLGVREGDDGKTKALWQKNKPSLCKRPEATKNVKKLVLDKNI